MRSYTNSGPFVRINKSILTNPSYTDAGAAPFYYYQVLAVNDLGEGPPCASVRTTPTFPIQINCGDSNNDAAPFLPDQLFQNLYGSNNQPTGSTGNTIDTSSVTNPAPQAVYQTYRNDPIGITYTFPNLPTTGTTGAAYTLRQHFAADGGIYALSTFDILVNGTKFRSSYYPAAAAYNDPHSSTPGQYEAVTLACNTTADSNGNIVVTLNETYVRAYCNGIELYAGTLPTIITTPTGLKTTGSNGGLLTVSWKAVSGATGYNVLQATTSTGPYVRINPKIITSTNFTNTVTKPVGYYEVLAVNNLGEGPASAAVDATSYFALSARAASLTVARGNGASVTLTTSNAGKAETVTFSVSGVPAGVLAWCFPSAISMAVPVTNPAVSTVPWNVDPANAVLNIVVGSNAAPGTYQLMVTAKTSGFTQWIKVPLTIN